ncbi:hypothetical protein G4228_009736 [Cervus hanglu yarkandensis]|nr:hypothetical protein G4228_009736 [Cervus hanglu yarkandensis]
MANSSLYITTSQLTVSGEQPREFTCSVFHAETNDTITKTVSTECVKNFSDPSVKLFYSSCNPSGDTHTTIQLLCRISGYTPGKIKVTWLVDGHESEELYAQSGPEIQEGNLTSTYSEVNITQGQWVSEKTYTCRVNYYGFNFDNHARRCTVPCPEECLPPNCEPSLSLHPPALEDLLLGSNASLTCTLSGLKSAQGASFTWNPTGGKTAVLGSPKRDSCGCYSVSSVLPGCADPWNSGQSFSCSATHPDSKSSLTASIKKNIGNTFRPQVHLLPPPSEELALNELVTLTCLVRGFNPKDVLVRWLQGNQELPREKYVTWDPLPEPGQSVSTFTVTSVLRVDAEVWKQGDNFSCMVGHEALPLAFTQKTIDRLAGKPTHVNVSVVMSEVDGVCY